MKVQEAAKLLQVCRQTIYNLEARGQLFILHLSSRLSFVRRCDIDALFEKGIMDMKPIPKQPREQKTIITPSVQPKEKPLEIPDAPESIEPDNESSTEWATAEQLSRRFNTTVNYIYTYVNRCKIPKKKEGRTTWYLLAPFIEKENRKLFRQTKTLGQLQQDKNISKSPKNKEQPDIKYITPRTASKKYHYTASAVRAQLDKYRVSVIKKGATAYFLEADYKKILKQVRKDFLINDL